MAVEKVDLKTKGADGNGVIAVVRPGREPNEPGELIEVKPNPVKKEPEKKKIN